MSDEETQILQTEEGQMLTAEYKDGQLQIVEVTAFDKSNESHILPDLSDGEQTKYLQVLDPSNGMVQLDLLNFTLVKCADEHDGSSYQVVGSSTTEDGDTTLTCVLSNDDNEESENQDSYVMVNTEEGNDPLVFLQSSLQQINQQQNLRNYDNKKRTLTPTEILEKAKALQKAKALIQAEHATRSNNRGRKRKSDLPPPMELLSSPNFKLYLYSCKLCSFKCNAIKEMSKHKATEHAAGRGRAGRLGAANLQCARCPFRGGLHSQLIRHVQDTHGIDSDDNDAAEENGTVSSVVCDADVLVCGACGFESGQRDEFTGHMKSEHGVTVMLKTPDM